MKLDDIKKWYAKNGMEYIPEDWEGSRTSYFGTKRKGADAGMVLRGYTAGDGWWADKAYVWAHEARTPQEQMYIELLEEFFTPYLALLSRTDGNLVRQLVLNTHRLTYAELAKKHGLARQSAWEKAQRALQRLTRSIAEDDPQFEDPKDQRRRDFDAEQDAARRVLKAFILKRGYSG